MLTDRKSNLLHIGFTVWVSTEIVRPDNRTTTLATIHGVIINGCATVNTYHGITSFPITRVLAHPVRRLYHTEATYRQVRKHSK